MIEESYQIPILLYHRIVKKRSDAGNHKIWVLEKTFRKQMQYLKDHGYNTITFKDIENTKNQHQSKTVMLTFDDGYADNYHILFPILKEFNFKAVIYWVSELSTNKWGVVEGEPECKLLTDNQIKEMSNYGIEFGGHTGHHKDLQKLNLSEVEEEIATCKMDIEQITKLPVFSFAYPFGSINEKVKKIVNHVGYKYAVSTNTGPYKLNEDFFQIRRIEISPCTSLSSFKRKVSGHYFSKRGLFQKIVSLPRT